MSLKRSNQVKIKPADSCSLPCRSALSVSQRKEPVCAVRCFWGLLHPQLKPWLQPAELRFKRRSRAVLQATAAGWVTAPVPQKSARRAQLCPFDLLHGVYVKAFCTATSQGHSFDLGHLVFDIICKHFWKHNEQDQGGFSYSYFHFCLLQILWSISSAGAKVPAANSQVLCCSVEYNCVSFPVNELRPDFTSPLARKNFFLTWG